MRLVEFIFIKLVVWPETTVEMRNDEKKVFDAKYFSDKLPGLASNLIVLLAASSV